MFSHQNETSANSKLSGEWEQAFNPKQKLALSPDFTGKLENYQQKTEEKLEKLLGEKANQELEECTFQPKVNSPQGQRTVTEFLSAQAKHENSRNAKLKVLQEEKQRELTASDCSYTPSICSRSSKLSQLLPREASVFQKLHSDHKGSKRSSLKIACCFIPSVNKRSKCMFRAGPVDEVLYQDAVRRQNKRTPSACTREFSMSSASQKVLMEKVTKDFDAAFEELDALNSGHLDYSKFALLLGKLGFLSGDSQGSFYNEERNLLVEAWGLLGDREARRVSKKNLMAFVVIMMDLLPVSRPGLNIENSLIENDPILLEQLRKVYREFSGLYRNKLHAHPKRTVEPETHSFKPRISHSSSALALNVYRKRLESYGSSALEDVFTAEKQRVTDELNRVKQAKSLSDMKECTFRPKINGKPYTKERTDRNISLYNLSKARKDTGDPKENLDEECTFAPLIVKRHITPTFYREIKGTRETIERMQKGREIQQAKNSSNLRTPIYRTVDCTFTHKPLDVPKEQTLARAQKEPSAISSAEDTPPLSVCS